MRNVKIHAVRYFLTIDISFSNLIDRFHTHPDFH